MRRALRPLAFRLRSGARRLGHLLRPPRRWDGRHHPALLRFPPWSGEADGTFVYDFLGIKTDPRFRPQFRPQPPGPLETAYPPPHNVYFELVFVLEAVLAAADRPVLRVMELGAGYGVWLVTAHRAMQLSAGRPVELVGVEMVPRHFEWMRQHLRSNGIDPDSHTLIQAAVSDCDGEALFDPEPDPDLAYGQALSRRVPGARPGAAGSRTGEVRVPCIDIRRLLREQRPVDLLHVDIQGEELRALRHAGPELNRCVARLIVATHSRGIHRGLRRLLDRAGWKPVYDYGLRSRARTPFGDVQFLDGLLAYSNPRLPARLRGGDDDLTSPAAVG